ncbi:MAG: diaminopimelate decarboxylase [Lachnospiraceae bacterium]|jgi:diaminopimelate decarboxylase|nr:diaminopimelate decarboxylase [Lachnospiraceae bacterium]
MFLSDDKVFELIKKYGSPLYVYDERILRKSCREMHNLLPKKNLRVNYSAKANSNIEILKIVRDEDIDVDAMSPGEIYVQKLAGYNADRIFYIGNNVSKEEMQYAINEKVLVSVDSLAQLESFGQINPGGDVAVRFNPGIGTGHHQKVVTAGKKTKFGVQKDFIPQVKAILEKYNLNLVGIDQHIGSLFLEPDAYIKGVESLLEIATQFSGLKFIDMGGGFGVPYHEGECRLDLKELSEKLNAVLDEFLKDYDNKDVIFKIEPGRYIPAECGVLLGEVYSVKENYGTTYVGTDLGFNVLMRPVLYDSYHAITIIKSNKSENGKEVATIVGNICESGDIIANEREMRKVSEGDIVAVGNAGAYGFSMSSNYNCRLKPAEVLIDKDGNDRLIRRRDTIEDLIRNFVN